MLILYEIKAAIVSFALSVYALATSWRHNNAEIGMSVGYPYDVAETDK